MGEVHTHYPIHPSTYPYARSKSYMSRRDVRGYAQVHISSSRMQQTTSVLEYMEKFEEHHCLMDGVSGQFLISTFISGLKEEIQHDVAFCEPQSLREAFRVAQKYESKYLAVKKNFKGNCMKLHTEEYGNTIQEFSHVLFATRNDSISEQKRCGANRIVGVADIKNVETMKKMSESAKRWLKASSKPMKPSCKSKKKVLNSWKLCESLNVLEVESLETRNEIAETDEDKERDYVLEKMEATKIKNPFDKDKLPATNFHEIFFTFNLGGGEYEFVNVSESRDASGVSLHNAVFIDQCILPVFRNASVFAPFNSFQSDSMSIPNPVILVMAFQGTDVVCLGHGRETAFSKEILHMGVNFIPSIGAWIAMEKMWSMRGCSSYLNDGVLKGYEELDTDVGIFYEWEVFKEGKTVLVVGVYLGVLKRNGLKVAKVYYAHLDKPVSMVYYAPSSYLKERLNKGLNFILHVEAWFVLESVIRFGFGGVVHSVFQGELNLTKREYVDELGGAETVIISHS